MSNDKKFEIKDIPVMPQVATKIIQLQEENLEISFKELENIILLDPAITARILKIANSALYARQREITSLQQAITLLGFKTIKSMILLVCASNIYGKSKKKLKSAPGSFTTKSSAVEMWRHLIMTAFIAKQLAVRKQFTDKQEEIFIAGLLHDIGRIVFLINDPDGYGQYLENINNEPDGDLIAIEEKIFGSTHLEVGKIVLEKWNFPQELIDVIFQHHSMHVDSPHKKNIIIVGLADIYSRLIVKETLSSNDLQRKEKYIDELSLPPEADEYFLNKFIEDIQKEELFIMSSELSQ